MTFSGNPGAARWTTQLLRRGLLSLMLLAALFLLGPSALRASDHADPMALTDPDSNITDLFFFPKDDQMILIFNVRRATTSPKPYHLSAYDYVVHMDLTTPVNFNDQRPNHLGDRARYGGTIADDDVKKIHDDVTITIHMNDDTTLKGKPEFTGAKPLTNTDAIRVYTGVRDDPFIFPRFFKKNIVAMVLSIPKSSFPAGQQNFILWGTTHKDGKQMDHAGRSSRTQQGRFNDLNFLPPSQHLDKLTKLKKFWDDQFSFLNGFNEFVPKAFASLIQLQLQIRDYDLQPDVMIYSSQFPVGFPNGRVLTDDVGAQTCATGDCVLQELSFIEIMKQISSTQGAWPRATKNDKDFLPDFPFLADPWPDSPEASLSTPSFWPYVIGLFVIFGIVSWMIIEVLRGLVRWLLIGRKSAMA